MRIGIIGAGNMGAALAGLLAGLGHQVVIANSRGPRTLADVAARAGAAAVTVTAAASKADVVIVAIPEKSITGASTPSTPACPRASGCNHNCATRWLRRSTPSAQRAWPASAELPERPDAS